MIENVIIAVVAFVFGMFIQSLLKTPAKEMDDDFCDCKRPHEVVGNVCTGCGGVIYEPVERNIPEGEKYEIDPNKVIKTEPRKVKQNIF